MKAFVAGVKFTDPAKGKGGERDFIGLEPPLPPHERRNRMHIEFEESDYELFKKVFEDEDTATAAMRIIYNADSSGTLMIQIEEGYECDIFFSAAQKQMDQLEEDGLIMEGTRANVVKNQVVVVALKDSGTKVTGLENLEKAENIALAGGSVPVGNYTRQALMNRGILKKTEDSASVTTEQVSRALGGVEISEQDNR